MKHAEWSRLSADPSLGIQRMEIGLIVSKILRSYGRRVMDSIGHPIDAFKGARPYLDTAE